MMNTKIYIQRDEVSSLINNICLDTRNRNWNKKVMLT